MRTLQRGHSEVIHVIVSNAADPIAITLLDITLRYLAPERVS